MIETDAGRRGSPIDTKIEVSLRRRQASGARQLQAVRNSAITFKDIDSRSPDIRVENWQEMELNQYLYMAAKFAKFSVCRRVQILVFSCINPAAQRRNYFDSSSASAHALDAPCYIVEAHAPGEKLVPNGLPMLPIYYANDDDGERELGIRFTIYSSLRLRTANIWCASAIRGVITVNALPIG